MSGCSKIKRVGVCECECECDGSMFGKIKVEQQNPRLSVNLASHLYDKNSISVRV